MGLRRVGAAELPAARRDAVDCSTTSEASALIDQIRTGGESALRRLAQTWDGLAADGPLVLGPEVLQHALASIRPGERELLERTADRIATFARYQRACLRDLSVAVPGGRAGHDVSPVERAGCYAPGGRFPLPSSVLMTAVTARVAGVKHVVVASPRPTVVTLAAAAVAQADYVLPVGGAHAIAALAYGCGPIEGVDVVVGPGNRWVTAAKQLVAGRVGIDMLAGPSELVVLADDSADPATVAADLLAQAEHDPDARPILVTTSELLANAVDEALELQLAELPTGAIARVACSEGFTVICVNMEVAVAVCDQLAPEHLEVCTRDAEAVSRNLRHYGGLFIGSRSAEVFGDYGVGPNHVLPTGSTARFTGGLSVLHFLRVRTWLCMDQSDASVEIAKDAAQLARMEGLEGHARSAERRLIATGSLPDA